MIAPGYSPRIQLDSPAFIIDTKCRNLSLRDEAFLTLGAPRFLLDLVAMKLIDSFDCPGQFYDLNFEIEVHHVIFGPGRWRGWIFHICAEPGSDVC
jgi:hypothetical protein